MKQHLLHQGMRFVLVGGMNTAFSYLVYAACIFLGAGYLLASAVSMAGGILFSYRTTRRLVFGGDGSLLRFTACYLAIYCVTVAQLHLLDSLGIDPYLSGLIAAPVSALASFTLLRLLVFRHPRAG